MNWTRSETIALARLSCHLCHGLGFRAADTVNPCPCVLRQIFRTCHAKFRECTKRENYFTRASIRSSEGRTGLRHYALLDEEFIADFCLVARRTLNGGVDTPDTLAYKIFKFHHLLGASRTMCAKRLGLGRLDRGEFYNEVYRIEARLGKVFAELEPYALFPVDTYFFGNDRAKAAVRSEEIRIFSGVVQ
jgi:hypothetical protein